MYHSINSRITTDDIKKILCDPYKGSGMTLNIQKTETQAQRWFQMKCNAFQLKNPGSEHERSKMVLQYNFDLEKLTEVMHYDPTTSL